ncbi:uncharacterized protein BO97DRAFT_418757 [Aspergillus homomorphus CBS 101889]|uniref:Uncharacterized protein n=1 Tax=Aspergillus homomorphus (strain CBS 101889) TaxID=1450537 RepID=A0A395HLR2_ASPHC|nr:hypothetical protein BO97DRAFT_418757 [Aspergillus homomorphus CBS 101889]RAL07214.1 hypothetical protein BO97DRAFT_418757 [Aspergillus homomorphus CBS 101889]
MTPSDRPLAHEVNPSDSENEPHRRSASVSDGLLPPHLYQIVADSTALQPSKRQVDTALEQSRAYWYHAATAARFYHNNGIKPESANPHHMLWKVPRMRGRPKTTYALYMGASPCQSLCLQASTTWRLDDATKCERVQEEITNTVLLQIGTKAAVPYTLSGTVFGRWIGTEDEVAVGPNYLAILTLGWCYVLSARLVELQGTGASMSYTAGKAAVCGQPSPETTVQPIDIGETDDDTMLWWSSVLAPGEGWMAVVKQRDDGDFLAPWSVRNTSNQSLSIRQKGRGSFDASSEPLSSRRAFEALVQFALLHNLGSQFLVALATAMTVPCHNFHGSTIRLPKPALSKGRCPAVPAKAILPEWALLRENLEYYMTLSCHPEVIMSCLCGMFWEPGVPCNLVSPWLHPILIEVSQTDNATSDSAGLDAELLAIIGSMRRPTISALWLGAAAGGLTPMILKRVKRGRPPLESIAYPWTGCPQSFMDDAGTGPYLQGQSKEQQIWRADVWRLLHLPFTDEDDLSYRYRPGTPWEPCGKMNARDCALRVASHWDCPRHRLIYHHWNWELEKTPQLQDPGFSSAMAPVITRMDVDDLPIRRVEQYPHRIQDEDASQQASLEIFRWFIFNGEGFPPGDFYKNEWLDALQDDEDSEEESQGNDSNMDSHSPTEEGPDGLQRWLDTI